MNWNKINKSRLSRSSMTLIALCVLFPASFVSCNEPTDGEICRPELVDSPVIELGNAGVFKWVCDVNHLGGEGFYVVFIRPSGTYVLLKVPKGRTTFEFTPDGAGTWRWMVINTHPDRTKPDVESAPGFFQVVIEESDKK